MGGRAQIGNESELEHIEENGCIADADPAQVSQRAWERGREQLGTLGSGNYFLEVGYVAEIHDEEAAKRLAFPQSNRLSSSTAARAVLATRSAAIISM